MQYKVKMKSGLRAYIEYVCFGYMKNIDNLAWDSYWRNKARIIVEEDEKSFIPTQLRNTTDKEFLEFQDPKNYLELEFLTNHNTPTVDEALKHPFFDGFERTERGIKFTLEGRKIDECFARAFILRNAADAEYKDSIGAIVGNNLKLNAFQRVILDSAFYKWTRWGGEAAISMRDEDGDILSNARAGDLRLMLEGCQPEWKLPLWGDHESGYPRYDYFKDKTDVTGIRSSVVSAFISPVNFDGWRRELLAAKVDGSISVSDFENFILEVLVKD